MTSVLRFADSSYFLSGNFELDLESNHPILVDPLWKGTVLENHLHKYPLPILDSPKSFCLVTSGSTGLPKMVWKEWSEIESEIAFWTREEKIQSLFQETKPNGLAVSVPLCHLYGLLWGYLIPKRLGVSINIGAPKEGTKLWITSASQMQKTFDAAALLPPNAIVSGMKFPVPLARTFREKGGISVLEIYGSTETGAIGYRDPLRQNRFQILDEVETKFYLQEGTEEFELQIRSPYLSQKYFYQEEHGWVRHDIPPNEYYATNDLGNGSELGWYLLGRKDRIIKHFGKRVSLDRIESEILGLSLPGEFVCVGISGELGDSIGLFSSTNLTPNELIIQLRKELPESHIPKVVLTNKQIPKLPNGKIDYPNITNLCSQEYDRGKEDF
ncbi:acyl-CoA synthetase [Leptospira congkakensis]|uniref:Acyl-CoA synthetase n=1 Tax=Leptospira congkakensis TaxID=2484932 RepID=A0A4Z1AHM1_9LEPT|nr:AMP-binding protein [Leptospira congkakensis]TGL88178.1 acyl-CoA synthetase [Leptospira congkakensis]TGL95283.1 acyl-CoA synthetase [Leptospira congkakensis]TGL96365.1 acyl-CoA synthetase [Leptospira congkakensis]